MQSALAEVALKQLPVMRRQPWPTSVQVNSGGKTTRNIHAGSTVAIGRHEHEPAGAEHKEGEAAGDVHDGEHTMNEGHEMNHLEEHFMEENKDLLHQEPEKEVGYYSDQPYGTIMAKEVATVTGDVKSGLHDSCSTTKAKVKALVQCCSMSLDANMGAQESDARDPMTYLQAEKYCENEGMRLCTVNEFHAGRVNVQDATQMMWTSDNCDLTTPEGQAYIAAKKAEELGSGEASLGRLTFVVDHLEKKEAELQEKLHEILIKHAGAMESAKLPFNVDNKNKIVELRDYNLVVRSSDHKPGTGNVIVGLSHDVKHSDNGFVAGEHNTLIGSGNSVAGGIDNQAVGKFATILGGDHNKAGKPYSTIAGGSAGTAFGRGASVEGGKDNLVKGLGSVVAGGLHNRGDGKFAVVAAGLNNTATGQASTVLNGRFNEALGSGSGVAEGHHRINSMSSLGV